MGEINHKIAIVIVFNDDANLDLFEAVVKDINQAWLCSYRDFGELITSSGSQMNGFVQFTFNMDGSKEGWDAANEADMLRDKFFRAANTLLAMDRCVLVELPEEGPMTVRNM